MDATFWSEMMLSILGAVSLWIALPLIVAIAAFVALRSYSMVLNPGTSEPNTSDSVSAAEKISSDLLLQLRILQTKVHEGVSTRESLKGHPEWNALQKSIADLSRTDPNTLCDLQSRKAFWINVYNALTLHAVMEFRPKKSVWRVFRFFSKAAYRIDGQRISLIEIENGVLRANSPPPYGWTRPFSSSDPRLQWTLSSAEFDPRIHFALNCASSSCPPIAFYDARRIDQQLEMAATSFINSTTSLRPDGTLILSRIFKWYRRDFPQDLISFVLPYLDEPLRGRLGRNRNGIAYANYDWTLMHTYSDSTGEK